MSNQSLKRKFESSVQTNSVPSRSQFLNDKLSRRPDRHQLVEQRILHDSQCAPSLQLAEQSLKRARLADQLNSHLLNRPGPLELIKHKILHIDTNEHPNLEQAIQGGEITFKTTTTTTTTTHRRPLIFHEYTGPPSSCKPKVTKIDSLVSTGDSYKILLAQQQLLLELTSDKQDEKEFKLPIKSLEQMTLVELRDLCKEYQIPSSHANKTKLIERIKQIQNQITNQDLAISERNSIELSNDDRNQSIQISNVNEEEEVQLFSTAELDEILKSFSSNLIHREEEEEEQISNVNVDLDFPYPLIDSHSITNDDLFLQILLDNDYSLTSETTFDDLFSSDLLPSSSSLPRITSVDEFDAFLRDFTHSLSSHQQEVSTFIS